MLTSNHIFFLSSKNIYFLPSENSWVLFGMEMKPYDSRKKQQAIQEKWQRMGKDNRVQGEMQGIASPGLGQAWICLVELQVQ